MYITNVKLQDKALYDDDFGDSDTEKEPDAYLARVKAEAKERESDDSDGSDESTDEDFNPDKANESDVAEEYDTNPSSSEDSDASGGSKGSKDKEKKKEKKHKKAITIVSIYYCFTSFSLVLLYMKNNTPKSVNDIFRLPKEWPVLLIYGGYIITSKTRGFTNRTKERNLMVP